jgi:hypothetical protein
MTATRLSALALLGALGSWSAVSDEIKAFRLSPTYKEECGSCHVAYPPALLPAASWRKLMEGLDRHFGSDASLDPAKTKEITRFLAANAGPEAATRNTRAQPPLRITETDWFRREHRDGHDGITRAVWQLPSVKSPANCGACHQGAADGDFSEDRIAIPSS